ncbi:MAG: Hsp20/alpha crystallin family protein [Burkholderiales bacterium]
MANIVRSGSVEDIFGDLMKGFWVKPLSMPEAQDMKIKVDVTEGDKAYTVHAEIPGVKKEDIQVEVDGNVVSIRAEVKRESEEKKGEKVLRSERYYGRVERSFSLPVDIDDKATVAKYKDGVLDLTLPKKAAASTRRIAVE